MEPVSLLGQLGIDWKLLLSQVVNFAILLAVLTQFVYKPLLKVIKKRNERIQEGLDKANEADARLKEVDHIAAQRVRKAEEQAMIVMGQGLERARRAEESVLKEIEARREHLSMIVQEQYEKQREEARKRVLAEAGVLVKKLIIKTVELKPEAIDEALIEKAAKALQHEV